MRLWNAVEGKELLFRDKLGGLVKCVACSSNGKILAAATMNGTAWVWDIETSKELCQLKMGSVEAMALAPDGMTLAGNTSFGLGLWDTRTGKQVQELKAIQVKAVTFTLDGKVLATADVWGTIKLWAIPSGKEICELRAAGFGWPAKVAMAPGGRTVAALGTSAGFAMWDVATRKLLAQTKGADMPRSFAFAPDGRTLALGGQEQTVRLWDAFTGQEIRKFRGHEDTITALAFSADRRRLISGGSDGTGLVWDVSGGQVPAAGPREAKNLQRLWQDLASADAAAADRAFWALAASGNQTVTLLGDRLLSAQRPKGPPLRRLLTELDSDSFEVREKAEQELARFGEKAEPALRAALEAKPSPEVRKRVEGLLARLNEPPQLSPLVVEKLRAVRVLEQVGTPAARAVLAQLADGFEDPALGAEARAALKRFR